MSALIAALSETYGYPVVDVDTVDAFLAPAEGEAPHALLFFTGDPKQRNDTNDVAVVLPELMRTFAGRYRAAVVAREAEADLKARFKVQVFPSLVATRGLDPVGVLPRIRDWSDYLGQLEAYLDPLAPVLSDAINRVEITHSSRRIDG
ncbi:hydrogenase accessory protein [Oryzibacter oryziterrae]|uniref:hydrogenase accessory protein n=1 Tax=Oryzibacter oryziterrae TaxID=2766474 RepID=UPI001F4131FF|nr:hydrogenase accessory protein [Oryzibacter oryziterrae]